MKANSHYFGHQIVSRDIKDITVLEQPKTDIILGTYPCTKYSTVADLHATRTGDDLFLHFFRHVAIEQPPMYVVENVPGMKKFKVVMEAMTKLPDYYVNVFCPVDAENWLPQRRKRLIVTGTKKEFFIQPPQFTRSKRLRDIMEINPDVQMPDYVFNRLKGNYRDKPIKDFAKAVGYPSAIVSTTINQHFKKNFRNLINFYRVEEVKKRLAAEDDRHLSLLGVAFACGFNSEASFFRIFRNLTGMSPKDYSTAQKQ